HPADARYHIPRLNQDPVPLTLELPGDPLRPPAVRLGVGHEEVTTRQRAATLGHPARLPHPTAQQGNPNLAHHLGITPASHAELRAMLVLSPGRTPMSVIWPWRFPASRGGWGARQQTGHDHTRHHLSVLTAAAGIRPGQEAVALIVDRGVGLTAHFSIDRAA